MTIINPFEYTIENKVLEYIPVSLSAIPGHQVVGDELVGTATLLLVKASNGLRVRYETTAVANAYAYKEGLTIHRRQYNPLLYFRFLMSSLSSNRIFIGFTNKNALDHVNESEPTGGHYFGLLYDSSGPNWRIISRGGSSNTNRDTGIAANTGIHELFLEMFSVNGFNRLQWQIDDNDIGDDASNMPTDGIDLRLLFMVMTKTGATKYIELGKGLIDSDF